MNIFDFLRNKDNVGKTYLGKSESLPVVERAIPVRVHVPINKELMERVIEPLKYLKVWKCSCGIELKIRARAPRSESESNWQGVNELGHSKLKSSDLNWNGLANERGWEVEPEVKCPACQRGLTIEDYKEMKRKSGL